MGKGTKRIAVIEKERGRERARKGGEERDKQGWISKKSKRESKEKKNKK